MRRRPLYALAALAIFIATSLVGADVRSGADDPGPSRGREKAGETRPSARTVDVRTYRSPGPLHKIMVSASDGAAIRRAEAAGAIQVADYGSYRVFLITDPAALDNLSDRGRYANAGRAAASALVDEPDSAGSGIIVRDDFNLLMLRAGVIDTTGEQASGRLLGLGRAGLINKDGGNPNKEMIEASDGELRLVQFAGPIKRAWLDRLRASGFELIAYVPSNGYLVRGKSDSVQRLALAEEDAYSRGEGFLQWEGPYLPEYKVHPALARLVNAESSDEITVAVQLARGPDSEATGGGGPAVARKLASGLIGDPYTVLGFVNLRMRIEARRVKELAQMHDVVNIEPWSPPELADEASAQIIAGVLTDDGKQARGPGYMAWLQARGFTSRFGFAIDVTDTGLDRGATTADKLHPDFLDSDRQSRVVYARDYTVELEPGDIQGHGTINLSIAGGGTVSSEANMRDSAGFNYGLGIAPFVLLGSSRIFQSSGKFDLTEPYTKLISEAYRDGARISSNSWGAGSNSYTIDSQEYDARVRDAVPALAGNQEMVICFAAGNGGPGRVLSPGSGKNVISVAASENSRKTGTDGCGVKDDGADSALDIAFFSAGGLLDDGRLKPDLAAPGTHIQGAASQHPDFDGSGICGEAIEKPFFPKDQTLYTWSSGTSHATPQVAGAAALARQYFLNRGQEPSAALIKALLVNTPTYMTGALAGGNLPHQRQGWGLLNMERMFNNTPKVFVDQTRTFTDSGQEFVITGEVKDASQPFRVTLAWTDAPGLSAMVPWVNDLDLEVTINGKIYRGNNFKEQISQPGGEPNTKDNVEGVWLPAGTTGAFMVRVRATNVAGDGVPANADSTDQDFALAIYNGERKDVGVATLDGMTISSGADSLIDPGETVSLRLNIKNGAPIGITGATGSLATAAEGVTVTAGTAGFPDVAPGLTGESANAFQFTVARTVPCGSILQFTLELGANGVVSRLPFSLIVGNSQPIELFTDNIESGEAKWTHASAVKKKKKKQQPIDPWVVTTRRARSGGSAWFAPNLGKLVDAHLDTQAIQLPSDGRNLRLIFYHTFEFEPAQFDGAVLEISTGGNNFEDLGPKIIQGGYNGQIRPSTSNPLEGRDGWVDGRVGQFQPVVVDLSSYAGKTVTVRFRIGTDLNIKGIGWYIDDVTINGDRITCNPAAVN